MMKKKSTLLLALLIALAANTFGQHTPYEQGQVLVQMSINATQMAIQKEVAEDLGLLPDFKFHSVVSDYMRIVLFTFDENAISMNELLRYLNTKSLITVAQANHKIQDRLVPNDPFYGLQWHHNQSDDHDIDTDLAWDITTGGTTSTGEDIVVCVVETSGAKWDQADLISNHWVNENEIQDNGIDDDNNGYVDDYDGWNFGGSNDNIGTGNHGTQVSSMIGAKGDNNAGISGVNWSVRLMQVQLGDINEAGAIAAYTYPLIMRKRYNQSSGSEGALIVATNSSWGINNGQASNSPLWCAMYDSLGTYGVISCASTTNVNANVDVVGDLPTQCPSEFLISVTSTNTSDIRANSGYGIITVDLGAPGQDVYLAGNSGYATVSGTSFASPCVAGAVALLYSAPCTSIMDIAQSSPSTAAQMIRDYLFDGVDAVSNLAAEVATGGRLNVKNSLDLLLNECSAGECIAPFVPSATQQGNSLDYMLNWGATALMTSFHIQYRIEGGDWIDINGVTTNSFILENVLACSTYEFRVMSLCDGAEGEWSPVYTWLTDGCCEHPAALELVTPGETALGLEWTYVVNSGGYVLSYYSDNDSLITINNIPENQNNMVLDGLTACTTYYIQLMSICYDSTLTPPAYYEFSTNGCGSCADLEYCASFGSSTLEFIQSVVLEDIQSISVSNGGYIWFEDQITTLNGGETYTIYCTPGYSGSFYNERFRVWIDYNGNGVFESDTEVIMQTGSTQAMVSSEFTVPLTVLTGVVRMRVSMKYVGTQGSNLPAEPCGDLGDGEVEDYCIALFSTINISEESATTVGIYPNPTSDAINITFDQVQNPQSWKVQLYDISGSIVLSQSLNNKLVVDLSALPTGIYHVELKSNMGEIIRQRIIKL
jgi:serine protease